MAPATKSKAGGVSATSFFDLKSELAKQAEEFTKNKATTGAKYLSEAKKTKSKVWARSNKGVEARARRDIELEEVSRPTLESARAALERKAQLYEKLRKGKSGGLSEKQYDALLVDFDSKTMDRYESDSDDVDESLTVPRVPEYDDDPVIEYEDEFGRIRTARRSEVPRHLLPTSKDQEIGDEDPSAERVKAMHYDATKEVRAKGAAFYQFSADEETRRQQMEELRSTREETKKTREEVGAIDVAPGEVEAPPSQPKLMSQTPVSTTPKDPFAALEQVSKPPSPEPKRAAVRSQAAITADADAFLAQLEQEVLKKRK
ncbi:hypothetical protein EDC04DRAFT_2885077 [Pisolithus marmoratus]|nr:hypothetical protein EDC04DRAFT_2885077 [Pisolithus marmoratus]